MKSFRALTALPRARPQCCVRRAARPAPFLATYRPFHASAPLERIETHVLSDIGEGVKEVQIIQWFVEEGAAIEEWAPLCEVQSDKASVEITSKFNGVIKKLHFERDAVVQVGDGMLDIEVEGEDEPAPEEDEDGAPDEHEKDNQDSASKADTAAGEGRSAYQEQSPPQPQTSSAPPPEQPPKGKHATLATPAVRGLLKEHKLNIEDIHGSGKEGRVLKEDVFKHLEQGSQAQSSGTASKHPQPLSSPSLNAKQTETAQNLTPIQTAMFKSMTKSLTIPHFLYSDSINVTTLSSMRRNLNQLRNPDELPKLSYMPFAIKAVSLALNKYPLLNARIDTSDSTKPKLQMRSNHNIGIAMDTPNGLLVPVIKTVNARSVASIASEIHRLAKLGAAGKLTNEDLSGGTITVSNIGNIGGEVLSPVIVEGQLAIMGMGKIKAVPVFAEDGKTVERAEMMSMSWSADHRVVDGATMARMAKVVQGYLESPETMIVDLS